MFRQSDQLVFCLGRLPDAIEYQTVPANTRKAPDHIIAACQLSCWWVPKTDTLMTSDAAFRTTKTRVTVREETLDVSLFTPATQTSWVIVLRMRGRYAEGIGIGECFPRCRDGLFVRTMSCEKISFRWKTNIGMEKK